MVALSACSNSGSSSDINAHAQAVAKSQRSQSHAVGGQMEEEDVEGAIVAEEGRRWGDGGSTDTKVPDYGLDVSEWAPPSALVEGLVSDLSNIIANLIANHNAAGASSTSASLAVAVAVTVECLRNALAVRGLIKIR
jgi:hypothetical protein